MLEEIIIAIQSYFKAHRFIVKNKLWKWIFIPGVVYAILFVAGIYFFWESSAFIIDFLLSKTAVKVRFLSDIVRGISIALRNTLWQTVYTISILLLALIPVLGWITPLLALFVECFYFGFSMLDYTNERRGLSSWRSIANYRLDLRSGICCNCCHFKLATKGKYNGIESSFKILPLY